ncbi:AAA family ATPase [Mucilaginibacter sp. PAMB04274]|uniref:AAA family ATPase n=1 Tax=Mucilaginibacter sp. PAMB04274 TaxID=3138568 RepID=UPI0031F65966
MNIERLTIKNFRNIGEERSFELDPKFTTIIGINGKGKSTILHALRIACGAFFLAIPEVKKRHIKNDDIHLAELNYQLVQQKPVKIEAVGMFPGYETSVHWKRQITENSNTTTSSESEVGIIRNVGKISYAKVTKGEEIPLPVVAFFGTSRAHGAGRNVKSRLGRQVFKEGYQDWFEMKSTTFNYESWLRSYKILRKQGKERPRTREAFLEAIKTANPHILEVETENGELLLKVKLDEFTSDLLPISLHSDGIRFFTEMVAELAFRCVTLNGFLDDQAVRESKGVVMIDEIDLHLHPKWQKHVVEDLKKAFPNIQFVVTTHSPFIVQSLKAEELINLDTVTGLDDNPDRYSIEEIASQEMGVDHVQRSETFQKMQRIAKEYFDLIKTNASAEDIQRAKLLLDEIRIKYNNDPAYVALLESEFPNTI